MRRCTGSGSGRAAIVVWVLLGWLAGAARGADDSEPAAGARFAPRACTHRRAGRRPQCPRPPERRAHGTRAGGAGGARGDAGCGAEALPLGTGDFAETRTAATLLTASAHYDHYALYGLRGRFIAAAFPGARYGRGWLRRCTRCGGRRGARWWPRAPTTPNARCSRPGSGASPSTGLASRCRSGARARAMRRPPRACCAAFPTRCRG